MSTTATIPTKSEKTKLTPVENHKSAAAHFTEAAKHHTDAAKLVEAGHEEKAAHATVKAHGHQIIAHDAHKDAVKQYAVKN
jgi:negative regulator of genetic competence, sporulation and motility